MQKGLNVSKFVPKWEELYILHEAYHSGYYLVWRTNSEGYLPPINGKLPIFYFLDVIPNECLRTPLMQSLLASRFVNSPLSVFKIDWTLFFDFSLKTIITQMIESY